MTQEHPAVTEGASVTQTPATETAHYADGSSATGPDPMPDTSPSGASRVEGTDQTAPPSGTAAPVAPTTQSTEQYYASSQPKPEAESHDPLAGAEGDPNRVPSASSAPNNDSLLAMARVKTERGLDGSQAPADQTNVIVIDGHEAASTPNGATGAYGQALPPGGEVAGGNFAKVLDAPRAPDAALNLALTKERAALLSPVGRRIAGIWNRPPAEWGVVGPGETIRGHMFLLDMSTGEKVEAMDGHVINDGKLYVNLRNLPESIATGDTIQQLLATA